MKKTESCSKHALPAWTGRASLALYFVILVALDTLFRALYCVTERTPFFSWPPIVFTLAWSAAFTAVAYLLPKVPARIFVILTVLIYSILAVVHAVMYHLFGSFFTFSDLLYAGEGAKFFSLSYVRVRILLILGVACAVIGSVVAAVCFPKRIYTKSRLLTGFIVLFASIGCIVAVHFRMLTNVKSSDTMSWMIVKEASGVSDETFYTEFTNKNICLPLSGLYHYTCRDLAMSLHTVNDQEREEGVAALDAYFSSCEAHSDNEMTGILAGKNVIMIMVESLDTWMVTPEFMPNLYALQQKSVNFANNYTPLFLSAGTFSTEFVTLTGIIPPMSGVSTDVYVGNSFPDALPYLFAEEGYHAESFHGSPAYVYNRGVIHRNLGFTAYNSGDDMGMENFMLDSQLICGFDQMTGSEPFFSYVITYSGHGAYDETMSVISQAHIEKAKAAVDAAGVTASDDTMAEFYEAVGHIMETDAFIGELVEKLEESGHMEDTVLIVYGDHYCKYLNDTEFLMSYKQVENRNLLCNTPFFIYSPELEPQTVEKYVSSVDMFPTICNLFGLNVDLSQFVGNDIFGDKGGYVYWRDYSWYDGETYVDSTTTQALTEEQERICNEVREKLNVSWNVLKYNYFADKR